MKPLHQLSRRSFLSDFGKGTVGVAILGLSACSSSGSIEGSPATTPPGEDTSQTNDTSGLAWERVNRGFVSAYVLARGSELTVVDTGNEGSQTEILGAITKLGGTWDSVKHVILTHSHGDHVGSLKAVLTEAPEAKPYAGTADIANIAVGADLTGLNDGDEVFGLQVLATPGHTPGHICVYDEAAGLLIAGDALRVEDGKVLSSAPQFSSDIDLANESAKGLANSSFETLLVGHGEPILAQADAAVQKLVSTL